MSCSGTRHRRPMPAGSVLRPAAPASTPVSYPFHLCLATLGPPLRRPGPSGAAPTGSIIKERITEVLGADLAQFQDDSDRLPCLRLRQGNRDLDPLQPLAVIWRHRADL